MPRCHALADPAEIDMRRITVGILIALCAITSPNAQAPPSAQGSGGASPGQSRVTGTITVALDARETPRKLLHARETLAVTPGPLTLVYPKWLPGEHAPDGAIDDLVGLKFSAGGKTLSWRRDPVDQFAFHLDVPQGLANERLVSDISPNVIDRIPRAKGHRLRPRQGANRPCPPSPCWGASIAGS